MNKVFIFTAFILAGLFCMWKVSNARRFQFSGESVPSVATSDALVALTFDDGPSLQYTDEVLAILGDYDAKATFFVTGRETTTNLSEAKRLVEEGHELGNHAYSHRALIFSSPSFIRREIEQTDSAIRRAGYSGEIHFRPPYCKKLFGLPLYLSRTGRKTITWDIEPESYPEIAAEADKIAEHVFQRVRPGSIILLHVMYESRRESRKALLIILAGLRERRYAFVTVSELIASE